MSGSSSQLRVLPGRTRSLTKIVSLNIRHGGGKRQRALAEWLIDACADVLVLTEWRKSSVSLGAELVVAGYTQTSALREEEGSNGVAMFCSETYVANRVTPSDAQKGELLLARIRDLLVLAAYFPQRKAKASFFERCAELASNETKPMLLIGDLNTGSNVRDIEPGGAQFHCEQEFNELTLKHGLADLWRKHHGEEAREWTWRSSKNGFRIDHAFANRAFLDAYPRVTCWIDHSPRNAGISDHSALVVDLVTTRSGEHVVGR